LDKAKQGTVSSGFASVTSFVIKMPLEGCQSWGGTVDDAYKTFGSDTGPIIVAYTNLRVLNVDWIINN
jgi:hypothetical protein